MFIVCKSIFRTILIGGSTAGWVDCLAFYSFGISHHVPIGVLLLRLQSFLALWRLHSCFGQVGGTFQIFSETHIFSPAHWKVGYYWWTQRVARGSQHSDFSYCYNVRNFFSTSKLRSHRSSRFDSNTDSGGRSRLYGSNCRILHLLLRQQFAILPSLSLNDHVLFYSLFEVLVCTFSRINHTNVLFNQQTTTKHYMFHNNLQLIIRLIVKVFLIHLLNSDETVLGACNNCAAVGRISQGVDGTEMAFKWW